MDPTNTQSTPDAPRPIETASATTSPSNSSSGPFAYIVAAIALAACLAMGLAAKGCTSLVGEFVGDEMLNNHNTWEEFVEDDDSFPFDDYIDDYNDDWTDRSQDISLGEVLDKDLALYGSIDTQVGALAYANVRLDVSQIVRDLVLIDRNATNDVSATLRTAAGNEDRATDALEGAKERATQTLAELEAYEIPRIDGEDADEIADELTEAKKHTIQRWEAIQAELDVLTAHRNPKWDDVEDADEEVADATADAADAFLDALSAARHL